MSSSNVVKARASKLREALSGHGYELKHSESLEVLSKIEGYPNWNTHLANISGKQQIAEQILEEMLEADYQLNYKKFTKRWEEHRLETFTEKKYVRGTRDMYEDYGSYVSREYLGSVNDCRDEIVNKYPGSVRHIWCAVFEKGEVAVVLGLYQKNGNYYVNRINFS